MGELTGPGGEDASLGGLAAEPTEQRVEDRPAASLGPAARQARQLVERLSEPPTVRVSGVNVACRPPPASSTSAYPTSSERSSNGESVCPATNRAPGARSSGASSVRNPATSSTFRLRDAVPSKASRSATNRSNGVPVTAPDAPARVSGSRLQRPKRPSWSRGFTVPMSSAPLIHTDAGDWRWEHPAVPVEGPFETVEAAVDAGLEALRADVDTGEVPAQAAADIAMEARFGLGAEEHHLGGTDADALAALSDFEDEMLERSD